MDATTQRRSLTMLAGGLVLAGVAAVGWSLSAIDTSINLPAVGPPPVNEAVTSMGEVGIGNDDVAALALRRPLVDPPPPKPVATAPKPVVPPVKPKPTLQLTLVGTIIGSDARLAIITDATGNFDVKGVGEALELLPAGVSVQRIDPEQVELEFQGKRSTVKLDKEAKAAQDNRRPAKARRRNR